MAQKKLLIVSSNERVVTNDELELVRFFANDNRTKDIQEKTGKNVRTLEARIIRAKNKFGCNTHAGLVALFFRNGLID